MKKTPPIPAKEVKGAIQQMGTCRFCEQTAMINSTGAAPEEWLDEQATLQCTCTEAMHYKKMQNVKDEIDMLLENFPDITEFVKHAADLVENGTVASVSINTGMKVKINITMDTKGNLKVKATETRTKEIGA